MHSSVMRSGGVPNGNNTLWSFRIFLEPNSGDALYGNNILCSFANFLSRMPQPHRSLYRFSVAVRHRQAGKQTMMFSSQGHIFEPNIEPNIEPKSDLSQTSPAASKQRPAASNQQPVASSQWVHSRRCAYRESVLHSPFPSPRPSAHDV